MKHGQGRGIIVFLVGLISAVANAETASADVICEPLQTAIPELETAKSNLASGEYGEFFQSIRGPASDETQADDFGRTLADAFPDGFVSCSTILHDVRSERFVEEVGVFESSDGILFFLYWSVMMHAGEWVVLEYRLSTEFSEITQSWK